MGGVLSGLAAATEQMDGRDSGAGRREEKREGWREGREEEWSGGVK